MNWNALTTDEETGGATILSYSLEWDNGSGLDNYTPLVGYSSDFTGLTYQVSSNVSAGTTYRFRIRAKNVWSWSNYSSVVSALPSAAPDPMAQLVSIVNDTTGAVKVSWTAPADNSAPITEYKIEILDKQGLTWYTNTTHCDGANASIFANK